jgi:hypothetical protein
MLSLNLVGPPEALSSFVQRGWAFFLEYSCFPIQAIPQVCVTHFSVAIKFPELLVAQSEFIRVLLHKLLLVVKDIKSESSHSEALSNEAKFLERSCACGRIREFECTCKRKGSSEAKE